MSFTGRLPNIVAQPGSQRGEDSTTISASNAVRAISSAFSVTASSSGTGTKQYPAASVASAMGT